jgi:cytochrome c nitrite reductase small subunit
MRIQRKQTAVAVAIIVGVLVGLGSFTFDYAEGLSYFGNNPQTCVNCHIMNDQYAGWTKASHHALATCNDCHLTNSMPMYYLDKGLNGFNHSKAFTLQNFHEPILINERNSRILQSNCIRCHGEVVSAIVADNKTDISSVKCVSCHQAVGHGPVK